MRKRVESEQWLDSYARFQFVEYYKKIMEELELVQKKLLKALIEETEETENKYLISQLSKTIIDNSKLLADFGFTPLLMSKISGLILINHSVKRDQEYEDGKRIRMPRQNTKGIIDITLGNEDQYNNNKEDNLTEEADQMQFFNMLKLNDLLIIMQKYII